MQKFFLRLKNKEIENKIICSACKSLKNHIFLCALQTLFITNPQMLLSFLPSFFCGSKTFVCELKSFACEWSCLSVGGLYPPGWKAFFLLVTLDWSHRWTMPTTFPRPGIAASLTEERATSDHGEQQVVYWVR